MRANTSGLGHAQVRLLLWLRANPNGRPFVYAKESDIPEEQIGNVYRTIAALRKRGLIAQGDRHGYIVTSIGRAAVRGRDA